LGIVRYDRQPRTEIDAPFLVGHDIVRRAKQIVAAALHQPWRVVDMLATCCTNDKLISPWQRRYASSWIEIERPPGPRRIQLIVECG
jgi:hypothetical protein